MTAPRLPRPNMRRVVAEIPNGFTLANLFCGVFAIIAATRGEYVEAGRYVVWGGVADALDGRIARATRSGTQFGSELDSLVDAITFGLAPALIMYFAVLNRAGWYGVVVFGYTACAVIRLARFNVTQAGRAKKYFIGLPSPAAGITLATYYWFSQTPLYYETILGSLPWATVMPWIMGGLAFLMISPVPYLAVPTVGLRSWKGILGLVVVVASFFGVLFLPKEFFFPAMMVYVIYGVVNAVVLGLLDRLPSALFEDDGDDGDLDDEEALRGERRGRRRRRRRSRLKAPFTKPPQEGET